jgi:uncharacterized protein YfiM (DUF2279 family)
MTLNHPIRAYLFSLAAICAAVSCEPAHAGRCTAKDKWSGPDKTLHMQAGGAIGFVGALDKGDYWQGVRWAAYVGAAKELVDATGQGTCSVQDFVATVVGGAIGSGLGVGLSMFKDKDGAGKDRYTVTVTKEF